MIPRCGSKRHTLLRCKKPINPSDPLPFAACFVCSGKGHLVSSCPRNKARGIYPNGGSCKLCGDATHLAKNCGLMNNGQHTTYLRAFCCTQVWPTDANGNSSAILFGPPDGNVGADEDDFHTFKRRTAQIEMEEKKLERVRQTIVAKAGAHSGVVQALGKASKKIVYF